MNSSESAVDILQTVLEHAPGGLLTDIDGTISRVAARPEDATVEEPAREVLHQLARRVRIVAAVSGRSAEDARAIVGLDELVYSGNHGMELWRDGRLEQSRLAESYVPAIRKLLSRFRSDVGIPGMFIEDKLLTASIHFRGADDPEAARRMIRERARLLADELDLRVTEGRMVVEIRPPVDLDKGTSVLALIDEYGLESGVYLGDDVTDVDAFKAMTGLRTRTGKPFYAIGVNSQETPESVLTAADALVNGVDGVIELLRTV